MKHFLAAAIAGAAGLIALLILYPRFDPAASLHLTFDRDQAIAKARDQARKFGVDTTNWQPLVADDAVGPRGPLRISVVLVAPGNRSFVRLVFNPEGSLLGWHPDGVATPQMTIDEPAAPPAPTAVRRTARQAEPGEGVNVTIGESDEDARDAKASYLAVRILQVLCYTAAFVYFPISAVRRKLHYRFPFTLVGVVVIWGLVSYWGMMEWQNAQIGRATSHEGIVGQIFGNMPEHSFSPLLVLVFAAVGFSFRSSANRGKWASLELLAGGGFFNRAVGSSLAIGMMTGAGIAALPYLLAATGLFHGASPVLHFTDALVAPSPSAVALSLGCAVPALAVFGFIYPLMAKLRNPKLRWILFASAGVSLIAGAPHLAAFDIASANLALSVLLFASYTLLYRKTDLLATIAAMISARAILTPAILLAQPSGLIRSEALPIILLAVGFFAIAVRTAVRGREGAEAVPDAERVDVAMKTDSGRGRLTGEFEVARKAQQDALPIAAPALEGYTLAGSCEPAQQVGGDLFDYLPLADGRVAITVADVSGKGVPAALYMMVTKGLLSAIVRESSDLAYILGQVNLHLYRACKKKVFVTMAAVALDPTSRRLQHARAGHNPVLWRRARRGETVLLKPFGLGLGMAPAQSFSRTLKIEELELEPGDAIVLYSDGITEAIDSKMDQYGEQRLILAVENTDGQPAEESRAAILRDMAAFVGSTPPRDDVTLVVLRVAPEFAVA